MPVINVGDLRTTWTGDTDDIQDSVSRASDVVKKSFEKIKGAGSLVTGTFDKVRDFGKRAKESLDKLDISAEDLSNTYGTLKNNFDKGADLAELGAASLRVEDRFNKFSEAAGGSIEIMDAFQKGVGGTASEMDAMAISSGLLQAGLVKDAEGMERVTEIASRLGDQTSDVSSRIGEFSQLLKNQSIQLLDNFGISSGKVKERIKELQAETAGMTREQAFLTATFEQADAALAVLGPRTEDHLTAMERQAAASANLEVEIGQKLAPAYAKLADFQANMNAETAIAIKGFQKGFGTAVELSGGIDKLAINFGKLATKMGTSSAALGGLGLAVGALVLVNERLQQQLDKMSSAQDNAEDAAASLGDQVTALVDDGATLEDALDQVGAKVNKAGKEFDEARILGVIPLKNAFNASSKFADTMAASSKSLNKTISVSVGSFKAYKDQVGAYNATIEDSNAKIELMSETQFNLNQIMRNGASDASLLADEIFKQKLAVEENTDEIERTFPIWEAAAANQERGAQRAGEMADATEQLSAQIGAESTMVEDLARAEEQAAIIAEKYAVATELHAEKALESAAAMEIERQAAADLAVETANLAISLKDATEADIAKSFIGMLDPEKMGAKAYTKAVTDIGLKSGIMDEASVRLANDMLVLSEAVNENLIPMDDVSAALDLVTDNAETGELAVEDLISQFEKAPDAITPVGNALADAGDGMATISSQGSEAALMIDSFGDSTQLATPKIKGFQDKLSATEDNLQNLVSGSPWVVTVTADPVGGGGDLPDPVGGGPGFGEQSFGGSFGEGVNVEEMTVNVRVADAAEVGDTFEEIMAWAGWSG